MAAAMRTTLLAVAAMALLSAASAATYNVGEPDGAWDTGVDYDTWVSSKKFHPGDTVVFKYSPRAHDVVEVSEADYGSCSAASPITTLKTGNDVITLSDTGTRYFICGISGHCAAGMKVKIDVVAGSSPSPATPASGPGASNSPAPPSPSAATSVRAAAGLGLVVLLAGLMA
jgi:plastocyanin